MSDVFLATFDLVLMVDVLEHLPKDDGRALLDRIPGWIVVCTPDGYVESHVDPETQPTEVHRCGWTLADLEATGRVDIGWVAHGGVLARLNPTEGKRR